MCSLLLQNGANAEMRSKVNFLFQLVILLCVKFLLLISIDVSSGIVYLGELGTVEMETGNGKWKWKTEMVYKCTLE